MGGASRTFEAIASDVGACTRALADTTSEAMELAAPWRRHHNEEWLGASKDLVKAATGGYVTPWQKDRGQPGQEGLPGALLERGTRVWVSQNTAGLHS